MGIFAGALALLDLEAPEWLHSRLELARLSPGGDLDRRLPDGGFPTFITAEADLRS